MTLEEILEYRKEFYQKTMDYNFDVQTFDNIDFEDYSEEKIRYLQKKIVFKDFLEFIKNK
ncbi:MAG: hypothetical protein U9Q66_02485 [Patescibacteria group bacterium]|nr:hypothetical protein [Patescibacteria group bacterium]